MVAAMDTPMVDGSSFSDLDSHAPVSLIWIHMLIHVALGAIV